MLSLLLLLPLLQDPTPTPSPTPGPRTVVSTAKRHDASDVETPTGVTVIPRSEIEASTAKTLVDLLQGRAGLAVTRNSSTPQDAVVDARGFNNGGGNGNRLLVLVDGRKVNTVSGSSIDWAALPLENVESVEIIRGPAAAMYGDTAVAGVIRITTRRPTKDPGGEVSASYGSFATFRSWGAWRLTEGNVGVALFAGRQDSAGFRKNSALDSEDATALFIWEPGPSARTWAKLTLHRDLRQRPGTLTEAEADSLGRDATTTLGDDSTIRNGYLDLGAELEVLGGTLSPFLSFGTDNSDARTTFAGGTATSDTESQVLQLALKHVVKRTIGGRDLAIVAGLDGSAESAESATFNDFPPGFVQLQSSDYDRKLWGAYLRAELRLRPKLLVSAGIRVDRAGVDFKRQDDDIPSATSTVVEGDEDYSGTSPSASAAWFFTPGTSLYLSYGRTLRYPNRDELVGFLASALGLKPERATVLELGFRTREREGLAGSVVLYDMKVRDEIFFVPPAVGEDIFSTFNFGQNANVDEISHRGVELELEARPAAGWLVTASITLQRTTVESGAFDGKELPVSPDLAASLGARWSSERGTSASLLLRRLGERFLLNDLSNDVDALEAVTTLDLKFEQEWRRAVFFLEATNLFDEEYFDNGGIGADSSGIWGSRQAYNPAPGRALGAGVTVKF